jgi:hypothetical protein
LFRIITIMYITNQWPNFVMNEKDNPSSFDLQTDVTAITFLTIFIIIVTGILFVSPLMLNQNHTAIA